MITKYLHFKHHPAALGNIIEWYDFALYGYLASYLSTSIFPTHQHNKLILVYCIFASGIVSRLFGGIVFSHHGDTKDPNSALNKSVKMMAVSTALISFIPNYHTVGMIAPCLLLILRITQGISAGGQYSGSLVILSNEHALHRASHCALAYIYSIIGYLLANIISALSTHLFASAANYSLSWRAPFLLSIPLVLYINRRQDPKTISRKKTTSKIKNPIILLARNHLFTWILTTTLATIGGVFYFFIYVYLFNDMLIKSTHHPLAIYTINFICLVGSCYLVKYFAVISDKHGRAPLFFFTFTGFLILNTPMSELMQSNSLALKFLTYAGFITLFSAFTANAAAVYSEVFPVNIRYSGLALSYNTGIALSSFTPALATWLQANQHIIIGIKLTTAILSLLGLGLIKPLQKKINSVKHHRLSY